MSHTDELEEYDAELELRLKREYADVFPLFRYCVLTQEATYLCNRFERDFMPQASYPFFHITMEDVWVWDKNRPVADHPQGRDLHDPGRDGRDPEGDEPWRRASLTHRVRGLECSSRSTSATPRPWPASTAASELLHEWRIATERAATADELAGRPRPDPAPARRQPRRARRHGGRLGGARRSRPPTASLSLKYLEREALVLEPGRAHRHLHARSTTRTSSAPTASPTPSPPTAATAAPASSWTSAPRPPSTRSRTAGEYLGGVIAPGIETSLEALTARAARLVQGRPGRAAAGDRQVDRREHALGHRLRHGRDGRRGRGPDEGGAGARRRRGRHRRPGRPGLPALGADRRERRRCSPWRACASCTS